MNFTSLTYAKTVRARPPNRTCPPTLRWASPRRSVSATRSSWGRILTNSSGESRSRDNFSIVSGNHTIKMGGDWTAQQQRAGLPRLLRRPIHLRQRRRLPALRVARRAGAWLRAEHQGMLEWNLRRRKRELSRGNYPDRRPAVALFAGRGARRPGDRRGRRVGH